MKTRIHQIESLLEKDGNSPEYVGQLRQERLKLGVSVEDIQSKIENAKSLKVNSIFVQGIVDGFIQIKKVGC